MGAGFAGERVPGFWVQGLGLRFNLGYTLWGG